MNNELRSKINKFLITPFGSLKGIPATIEEIEKAEQVLNYKFSDDFIKFIKEFGGAYLGVDIYAFKYDSKIAKQSILELNLECREVYQDREYSKLISNSLVIAIDSSGNPIIISFDGKVIIIYHDSFNEMDVLADNFNQFINKIIDGEINDLF